MAGGISLPLALLGLVGSVRGVHLSAPVVGLACDSDVDDETLELGHRKERCACVQLERSQQAGLQALLRPYPGCDLDAERCKVVK